MSKDTIVHLGIGLTINAVVIATLVNVVWDGGDKHVILFPLGYAALLAANGIAWRSGSSSREAYKIITIGLLILFIPLMGLAIMR